MAHTTNSTIVYTPAQLAELYAVTKNEVGLLEERLERERSMKTELLNKIEECKQFEEKQHQRLYTLENENIDLKATQNLLMEERIEMATEVHKCQTRIAKLEETNHVQELLELEKKLEEKEKVFSEEVEDLKKRHEEKEQESSKEIEELKKKLEVQERDSNSRVEVLLEKIQVWKTKFNLKVKRIQELEHEVVSKPQKIATESGVKVLNAGSFGQSSNGKPSRRSLDSFEGMKPYRKPPVQEDKQVRFVQKWEPKSIRSPSKPVTPETPKKKKTKYMKVQEVREWRPKQPQKEVWSNSKPAAASVSRSQKVKTSLNFWYNEKTGAFCILDEPRKYGSARHPVKGERKEVCDSYGRASGRRSYSNHRY